MKTAFFSFFILSLISFCALGKAAPIYHLEDLYSAKKTDLVVNKITKPTVLFFWTSWCEYCKKILPNLSKESLAKFDVVSVSCDEKKLQAKKAYERQYRRFNPVYWLDKKNNPDFFIRKYPTLIIIRADGNIDSIYEGSQADKMAYFLDRLKFLTNNEIP